MAIIRPNTRNAFGVPARYSDLASAGLRWTPPPVYRYDAYDVQGDEATLYEEDIDLADYQYNADSYNASVVPAGYTAVCGGHARWLIGTDTKLYYKNDVGTIYLPEGSPSGVTRVAYSDGLACLAIVNGSLHLFAMSLQDFFFQRLIDNTRVWTEISFGDFYNDYRSFAIGIADGKLAALRAIISDSHVSILSHTSGWKTAGGITGARFDYNTIGTVSRRSSVTIDSAGYLYQVYADLIGQDGEGRDVFSPALSGALDLGTGWQQISGYMIEVASKENTYEETAVESNKRMYGIQDDKLYSLRHGTTLELGAPSKTQITEFTDWWRVTFVAPDEAVAIRKIAL
jgi:hypothetical protein